MTTAGRVIAIGDIHGCALALDAVLEWIAPRPEDRLIGLGDFIDRGPDSRAVIERLIRLRAECRFDALLGNHEEMLLTARRRPAWSALWLINGGIATLESYGIADLQEIPPTHWKFLDSLVPFVETETHLFFHANYQPDQSPAEMSAECLRWRRLDLEAAAPHRSGKKVVVGHSVQPSRAVVDLGYLVALDTGCYGDGYLSALDVTTGRIWQVDNRGNRHAEGS